MSKPTKEQIKEEIKNLKSIVDKVRLFSIFGNDNRANARAAIEVMEKDIDKNDIYQAWPDDEEGDERFNDERDTALTTRKWMDGEGEADFSPYNDFKGLVQ